MARSSWGIIEYFCLFQVEVDESTLSPEEQKERKIMKLLLKIKNGTPPMRKVCSFTRAEP